MKFGPVALEHAVGAVLAHSVKVDGGRLSKGKLLDAADVTAMRGAGLTHVTVAQLEPGDVDEDAAAAELGAALVPDLKAQGIKLSSPGTGRVNLIATQPGVVVVDKDVVNRLNAVDPMITLATVPQYHRTDPDRMIGTIKIISYSVPGEALLRACTEVGQAIRVAPPIYTSATLIETAIGHETPPDKGRAAMAGRLERLSMSLTERVIVPHDVDAIAEAIRSAPGEVVMILTASATSDPRDVGPAALGAAGGHVEAFGMPVDPGNLLFFGAYSGKPVVGLPGCARSPALNGADWVLERLICGINLTRADIAAMGVGGLLKEIPTRPQPRRPSG